jgi:hypothetical protein
MLMAPTIEETLLSGRGTDMVNISLLMAPTIKETGLKIFDTEEENVITQTVLLAKVILKKA